jgi:enoyl-CoA hydratase/carnithine racemase
MAYEEIMYSTKGPVGYLTLNNPSKINALSKRNSGFSREKNAGMEK